MDALARGLRSAAALIEQGKLDGLRAGRYASWAEKGGIGQKIKDGKVGRLASVGFGVGSRARSRFA
jgi:xylose isomerase